jgi:hypothetical protein
MLKFCIEKKEVGSECGDGLEVGSHWCEAAATGVAHCREALASSLRNPSLADPS